MGWTYRDLERNRTTLEQAKADHLYNIVQYGRSGGRALLLAFEWHPKTLFSIIRKTDEADKVDTFLRIDLLDFSGNSFGYKDLSEIEGAYNENKPSRKFAKEIFEFIPLAEGYAKEWRERNGVKYSTTDKDLFGNMNAAIKPELNQLKMEI